MTAHNPNIEVLRSLEVETAANPTRAVIWLHGLGADGSDFLPIVDELDLDGLPPIRFVFPNAPMMAVTINGGYVMPAWYDILSADFSARREDPQGVRASAAELEKLIGRENARGIEDRHIVLAGFSQGGAIALHTGLRHPAPLAGIMALSTYLPLADTLPAEAHDANLETSIFMAHGYGDGVIGYEFSRRSFELLFETGYPVVWHPYEMDHSVCMEEVRDIGAWLRKVLA